MRIRRVTDVDITDPHIIPCPLTNFFQVQTLNSLKQPICTGFWRSLGAKLQKVR